MGSMNNLWGDMNTGYVSPIDKELIPVGITEPDPEPGTGLGGDIRRNALDPDELARTGAKPNTALVNTDRAAMDAQAAMKKRLAAKKGYAGTFHSRSALTPSTLPDELLPTADRRSPFDRAPKEASPPPLKWDPAWLYQQGGPFYIGGSTRLRRK